MAVKRYVYTRFVLFRLVPTNNRIVSIDEIIPVVNIADQSYVDKTSNIGTEILRYSILAYKFFII